MHMYYASLHVQATQTLIQRNTVYRKCLVESNNIPPPLKILTANEAKPLKPRFLSEEDENLVIARRHYMQSFRIVRHPVHQCYFMTAFSPLLSSPTDINHELQYY